MSWDKAPKKKMLGEEKKIDIDLLSEREFIVMENLTKKKSFWLRCSFISNIEAKKREGIKKKKK